jgi:hypothetical protein
MPLSRLISPFTIKGATSGTTKFLVADGVSPNITFPGFTASVATLGTNTFVGNQSVTGNTTITGTLSASGVVSLPGGLTVPVTAIGSVYGASYTPSITNTTNVAASELFPAFYIRVGNTVQVGGSIRIDPTAGSGTFTQFELSLPVASSFTQVPDLGGAGAGDNTQSIRIYANATNDTAWFAYVTNNTPIDYITYTYTYLVKT